MAFISITYGDFAFSGAYPAPALSFDIENVRTSAGDYLMSEKKIRLNGICRASGNGGIDKLFLAASGLQSSILKQNNEPFIVKLGSNKILLSGNAVIDSIEFTENDNNWTQTVDYQISLYILSSGQYNTTGYLTSGFNHYVNNVSDNYSIELIDNEKYFYANNYVPIYKVSRSISAVGKRVFGTSGALYYAQQWVNNREKSSPLTGMLDPNIFMLYDQERNIDLDESAGSYAITDSFIAKSGDPWIDNYNLSIEIDTNLLRTITIDGYIQGLALATGLYYPGVGISGVSGLYPMNTGNFSVSGTKYANAVSGYNYIKNLIPQRVYAYDTASKQAVIESLYPNEIITQFKNTSIHPMPLSASDSLYPFDGKINYNRVYNTRLRTPVSGAMSENLQINSTLPIQRVKEIKVLGRKLGPLVYFYYNSSGLGTLTVNYEAVFPKPTGLKNYIFPYSIITGVDALVKSYQPLPPYTGYIKENNQTINLLENKITRNITWEYTTCR
jgi:hypothetical protein